MLRQPKKDRVYTVEVYHVKNNVHIGNPICMDSEVYATNPADAVVFAMRKIGYDINRNNLTKLPQLGTLSARVCLLGGTRESVTYYNIINVR